jgi:ribonucleoside-diphosphate reductase alpha chain
MPIADNISGDNQYPEEVKNSSEFRVIRRDGSVTSFTPEKIATAMHKAFVAVEGEAADTSDRVKHVIKKLTATVVSDVTKQHTIHIERIQDSVERALMLEGEHKVARAYVLYREERKRERESQLKPIRPISVLHKDGTTAPLDLRLVSGIVSDACAGTTGTDPQAVVHAAISNLYDGAPEGDVLTALIMAARAMVEKEPAYTYVAARLLVVALQAEVRTVVCSDDAFSYVEYFPEYIRTGIEAEILSPEMADFDLPKLAQAIDASRDGQFTYLGLQTLYDRYFLHRDGVRFEMPQAMFMRVAMGLALREKDREDRAIEFYKVLSSFDFMASTPTLFNSGTNFAQLSSCFLTTIPDDLDGIFSGIKDNALLAKYSGGLGNDWTPVRGMGARIKGTNGKSQGVIPFMKVANDTAVAVNQSGKRKGAVCGYLETWHIDIEEFLDLRKNTGDDRRRTHDMNTANWVPDLFMKRVMEGGKWTLVSPNEAPELHDLVGSAFEVAYLAMEKAVAEGRIKVYKVVEATTLWRKMLSMLYETGHPWITFKDPCNLRSPQQHCGVVHSSNLCTEITLNTSRQEVAVCNLGSINLCNHIKYGQLDLVKLERTVSTAMRMLDNVIDGNFYSIPQAKYSNLRHRPVGLGIMGFHDALFDMRIPYASEAAVEFADRSMEAVSYYAISASSTLAEERGRYASFDGSLWSRGIMPMDSIDLLEKERGSEWIDVNRDFNLDWETLRQRVVKNGMRNSNCLAIAPTATISNICGVSQSIEPVYQNLYVKSNMSGEFTVVNEHLAADLKRLNLWNDVIVQDLKYFDGSVASIEGIPEDLKKLYANAWEIDASWLVKAASRRQKWIDQSQSLNLYMKEASGKKLDTLYKLAWRSGLKTTYYLRAMGATHVEKSTLSKSKLNAVKAVQADSAKACSITDPDCEACQ